VAQVAPALPSVGAAGHALGGDRDTPLVGTGARAGAVARRPPNRAQAGPEKPAEPSRANPCRRKGRIRRQISRNEDRARRSVKDGRRFMSARGYVTVSLPGSTPAACRAVNARVTPTAVPPLGWLACAMMMSPAFAAATSRKTTAGG
jgi:hypothetical protein